MDRFTAYPLAPSAPHDAANTKLHISIDSLEFAAASIVFKGASPLHLFCEFFDLTVEIVHASGIVEGKIHASTANTLFVCH